MEQIPKIVRDSIPLDINVKYIGEYHGEKAYLEYYDEKDSGISVGYPQIWLYNGLRVISKCIAEELELYEYCQTNMDM